MATRVGVHNNGTGEVYEARPAAEARSSLAAHIRKLLHEGAAISAHVNAELAAGAPSAPATTQVRGTHRPVAAAPRGDGEGAANPARAAVPVEAMAAPGALLGALDGRVTPSSGQLREVAQGLAQAATLLTLAVKVLPQDLDGARRLLLTARKHHDAAVRAHRNLHALATVGSQKIKATSQTDPSDVLRAMMGPEVFSTTMQQVRVLRNNPQTAKGIAGHTDVQVAAMIGYTGHDYAKINYALRKNDAAMLAKLAPYVQLIRTGLAQLPPFVGTVHRGVDLSNTAAAVAKYRPGAIVVEEGFTSTSYDIAYSLIGNTRFVIESKRGRNIESLSAFQNEKEVLFMPGSRFRVRSFEKADWQHVIHLDEV